MLKSALTVFALISVTGSAGVAAQPNIGLEVEPVAVSMEPADLTLETLDDWHAVIEPTAAALADLDIDWETTIVDGVRRATTERKPLMIYVMNGHPLGCT